ncbi:MAG: CoA transferase [Alphaproteobacteria bacterium]|jgi:crotonobetainyl-CoA:carnitine CoA-transferase CaiB-like acyl-CoA transferase|nr:MAG: CoA transferase [Alphaproteobacteria bacterium]
MTAKRQGPLSRFKVIDLTRARAGPTAARQFADWGADVVKVEVPQDGDEDPMMGGSRLGPDFFNLHRNKRSITLNLKSPDGVAILKKMAAGADVLIENYRPDVKQRLGFDYETLRKINPRLVYVSLSGFGQDGPYGNRPGFDQIAQGMGGLMSITGLPGQGPVRVGVPIADLSAGMYAALGAFVALLEREVSGEGQWVQTSLLQAQVSMLDFQAARWLVARDVPGQAGNDHPTGIPTGVFPTSDGHINIAASGQHIYERCCKALGAESLIKDPDFANGEKRSKNRKRLNAELGEFTKRYKSAELVEKLNAASVPSGPIYSVDQMFADPQVQHLGIAVPMQHPTRGEVAIVNQAVALSRTPCVLDRPTPGLGEHTEEVLAEVGYSKEDIAGFRRGKVV